MDWQDIVATIFVAVVVGLVYYFVPEQVLPGHRLRWVRLVVRGLLLTLAMAILAVVYTHT